MQRKDLFIFDVDGTLVDAYQAIEKSLNFTLKQLGYAVVGMQKIKYSIGHGDKNFIRTFFRKNDIENALSIYRKHHQKALLNFSKLKPNARKVLSSLKRKNKNLAVASNRPKHFTSILLDKLDIKKYFDRIVCADEIESLKPNPKILKTILDDLAVNRSKAVYIGDMDVDLETARRAKVDAVFAKGGSSTLKEVKKYRNKKVISDLGEILRIYN